MSYRKYYIIGGAIILSVVLFLLLFRGCNLKNTHKEEAEQLKKENAELKEKEKVANLQFDSIQQSNKERDAQIQLYKFREDIAQEELNESLDYGNRLAHELKQAKKDKDTVKYFAKCDSLADHIGLLSGVIYEYEAYIDTLIKMQDAQLASKDRLLENRMDLYGQLRTQYDEVYEKYNGLYSDYKKAIKASKKGRIGIGVHAGYGINAQGQLQPTISAGINYNILKL
jgi:hypothetical protein